MRNPISRQIRIVEKDEPGMKWEKLLCEERPRKTTGSPGPRSQFERDFDRTVFSNPVKRLQDKAQVFPLEPVDAVRTRLTHSMEVSSVARGLGGSIGKWLLDIRIIKPGMDRAIEAIAATSGLIHDLGNPPFGHSGEDAIRDWFRMKFKESGLKSLLDGNDALANDFLKFEGNAQTLRLLTKLQVLADFNGLNLTYGTLSASSKYLANSMIAGVKDTHPYSKLGFFTSEDDVVNKMRAATGTGEARNPIALLMEAADDIVYSAADLEDGVKKGVISWQRVEEEFDKIPSEKRGAIDQARALSEYILRAGREKLPDWLPDDVRASAFRTASISVLVESTIKHFKAQYAKIMAGEYAGELVADCEAHELVLELKRLGRTFVYCTPSTLKLELMGRKVIWDLMDLFWEGAEVLPRDPDRPKAKNFVGKIGLLFSDNYVRVFQDSLEKRPDLPENYHRLQLVTDYICGMTDSFAKRLHAELTNGNG